MNQSNSSTSIKKYDESAFRTAVAIFIANLLSTAGWLIISLRFGVWQLYLLTGLLGVFGIVSAAAVIMIRRGKKETGSWMIIIGILILLAVGAFLYSGVAVTAGISSIILANLVANQMLESKSKRQVISISTVAGIATALLDQSKSEYRLFLPEIQNILPVITGLAALLLIFFIIRQSWVTINRSLRLKVTILTGLILAGSAIILIGYSTIIGQQAAIEAATKEALAITSSEARQVRVDTETPLNTARAMAQALTALKDPASNTRLSRNQVNAMLRQVLVENPGFLGTYTLWEPNAFDGLDSRFENTEAHDETGRFIPYWVRGNDGSVNVSALIDYETPGLGDWYLQPRQTKAEVTVAPLIYPINGVDTVMASFVVPIVYNDTFYGITGVDAPISFVQDIVDKVDLYNGKADAVLMTAEGTLIGVRNRPELVNQPTTELFPDFSDLQSRIVAGESFVSTSPDGQFIRAFSPVDLGQTGKHWSFALIIPIAEITAPATATAIQQGVIGILLVLSALALLWFMSGQIVKPVLALTSTATAISQGNLNLTADIQALDETGVLANAFNIMVTQLKNLLASLEQRVADRTRNLELAAEVGRTVSQVRALDVMLKDAAELIRKQFDLYYVQVYLTNHSQTYLNLQAGTGSVGAALLERNHRLPLNTGSINGRAAIEKRAVVIANTKASITFKANPLLPNTRSEMAVPLMIGESVVGVLDMQSEQTDSLSKDILPAFEALAGQLAIAIQNAAFLAETEQARAQVEAQAQRLSRANWREFLDAIHMPEETGFVFEQNMIAPMPHQEQDTLQVNPNALIAPIEVTGAELGNLVVEMDVQSPISRTPELVNAVARQVAQQVESLRLLESAERYRVEAEEASRRLTREDWKDYARANAENSLGYLYDLKEVRAYKHNGNDQVHAADFSLPLKVREEKIGQVVVQGFETSDHDSLELANAVAERLSQHIESLRLLEKTEESRSEIEYSQERLSEALGIAKLANWEYDVEKDIFTFNDNFYLIFHTTAKDMGGYYMSSGEYAQRFVHPEDTPLVGNEIGRALNSTEKYYTVTLEHRVLFVDGGTGYISVNVHVERDEQGKIQRFYGANQDITERKLAEEELRARETQLSAALTQTEKLYEASGRLALATNLQELVETVVNTLKIPEINRALLVSFNYTQGDDLDGMDIIANWWDGSGHEVTSVGTHYSLEVIRLMPMFISPTPVFFHDTHTDERVDPTTMDLVKRLNLRAVAVLPLHSGIHQIGALILEAEDPHNFTEDETRLYSALAPQVATVLDNRRQFERAQQQAERESKLNIISQKIQNATTVEAVLQIAARELGHALGAPMTVAQLSMKDKN